MAILPWSFILLAVASSDDTCRQAEGAMKILASGSIEEVWATLDSDQPSLYLLGTDYAEECQPSLIAMVTRAVARKDDARIAARVLDELDFEQADALDSVLRTGLRHP